MLPRWMRLIGAMIALLLGMAYWQRPDGLAHMYFLETPGDAFLMVTPSGKHLLIDGGTDPAALTSALGRLMPFWKRELDAVVLTRGDAAHATAQVAALARYHVREAFVARYGKADAVMREWQRLLGQGGTRIRPLKSGAQFVIDGVRVMGVGDGAALRVSYRATSVLLAHNSAADTQMPAGVRSADLVAYPWQLDPRVEWLEALRPKAIVFTDGVRVDAPALLDMDERAVGHAALYHEQLHGMIAWRSDGRRTAITIERSYCASISRMGWGALFASAQRPSASCNSRERS